LVLTWLILVYFIFLFWYIVAIGSKNIHASFPLILSLALGFLVFLIIFGGLLLVFNGLLGKDPFLSHKLILSRGWIDVEGVRSGAILNGCEEIGYGGVGEALW
jgi:hypothetical protein